MGCYSHHDDGGNPVTLSDHALARATTWLGPPAEVLRTSVTVKDTEVALRALRYPFRTSTRFVTVGASDVPIPGSEGRFPGGRAVRYEYILHCPPDREADALKTIQTASAYSLFTQRFVGIGHVLPVGEHFRLLDGPERQYVLLLEPFVDDQLTFTDRPDGQLAVGDTLIQFLWLIPIYESETWFIRRFGYDVFAETFITGIAGVADWSRARWR